ncbi:MAG: hypothetical protein HQM08_20615 [Candidatus Riflebacteria bacterium]|nr:hypothetical protein [Candidatus Riflebacteria bacterium]
MGKLIQLFKGNQTDAALQLTREQTIKLRLLENSVAKFRKEEEEVRQEIEKKCKDELDRLQRISYKIRELEGESEGIRALAKAKLRNSFQVGELSKVGEIPTNQNPGELA